MRFFIRLLFFVTLPLYVLDQVTKFWTVNHLPEPWSEFAHDLPVIENFFHWGRIHNQGVAFGLGNGTTWAPVVFLFVPIIALIILFVMAKRGAFISKIAQVSVALLLCGIFGNLTDRLNQGFWLSTTQGATWLEKLSAGYVVDFICVKIPGLQLITPNSGGWWPAFNVADSCVCVAASLLLVQSFLEDRKQ